MENLFNDKELLNHVVTSILVLISMGYYNYHWHIASKKDGISKDEVINNAFGNVFFILILGYAGGRPLDWDVLLIVVGGMGAAYAITAYAKFKNKE